MDFDSRNTTDKRKRVTLFSKREKKHELVNILKSTFNKLHFKSILELHGILDLYFNANNVSLSVYSCTKRFGAVMIHSSN